MTRVKRGTISRRRHKAVFSRTKGFRMTKNRLIKVAKEASLHQGQYAFAGRRIRRRDIRSLWILRISEKIKQYGLTYSIFMNLLKKNQIALNRKMLAYFITHNPKVFEAVVREVKK